MAIRPQPYRLKYPLTPSQVEGVDEMLQMLFKAVRNLEQAAGVSSGSSVTVSSPALMMLPGMDGEDGDQGPPGLTGATGATGPAGPSGSGTAAAVPPGLVADPDDDFGPWPMQTVFPAAASFANGTPKASPGGILAPAWLLKKITNTDTGAQNDWAPGIDGNSITYWSGASDETVSGFAGGVTGQWFIFKNVGTKNAFFLHQSGLSSAGNKLKNIATSGATPVSVGGYAAWLYDGTDWQLIYHEQGAFITPTFAAGNFAANGTMTWTVDAGDVVDYSYRLSGRTLQVSVFLITTTVGGVLNTGLQVTIPGGFTSAGQTLTPCFTNDNGGGYTPNFLQSDLASTLLTISKTSGANWSAAANNTKVVGVIFVFVT